MSPSLAVILPVIFGTVILVFVVFSIIVACTTPVEQAHIRRARRKPDPEKDAAETGPPPPHEAAPDDVAPEAPTAEDPDPTGDGSPEGGDEGDVGGGEAGGGEGGGDGGEEGGDGAPQEEANH